MSKDQEGYVWVLLTKTGGTVYVHGLYKSYAELQDELKYIKDSGSCSEIYSYEQMPL